MRPKIQDEKLTSSMQLMLGFHATVRNNSTTTTINNSHNEFYNQKSFVATKLHTFHKMSSNLYSKVIAQPALQYFLTMISDLKVDPKMRRRLGLRYIDTPEVQKLLMKLKRKQYVRIELAHVDANVIITTLK
ncbi:unnamed protein product, partial [Onchocerca ochengi]|uniref:MCM_lid domain-containing protein n=1 Tax=Onchocerca ochengi TaxID=42157 RepID=A0A182EHV5_ONCOC